MGNNIINKQYNVMITDLTISQVALFYRTTDEYIELPNIDIIIIIV